MFANLVITISVSFLAIGTARGQDPILYVTGMTVTKPSPACPVVVLSVIPKSPADAAGIRAGDWVLAVGDKDVRISAVRDVAGLIASRQPSPVRLTIRRAGKEIEMVSSRESESAVAAKTGHPTWPAEQTRRVNALRHRMVQYISTPPNADVYAGGVGVMLLHSPTQIAASVIDGPALRAGLEPGDIILAVDGVDPSTKTVEEVRSLLNRDRPEVVRLKVDRHGQTWMIEYRLQKYSYVLRLNQSRILDGRIVPLGIMDDEVSCFKPITGTN